MLNYPQLVTIVLTKRETGTQNREQHQLSLSVEVFWLGDIDARLPTSVESCVHRLSGGGFADSSQRPSAAQIFVSIEFPKAI